MDNRQRRKILRNDIELCKFELRKKTLSKTQLSSGVEKYAEINN
jgi:hypothetical protein